MPVNAAVEKKRTRRALSLLEESPHADLERRARSIYHELKALYPYAHAELDFDTPYQLLIATVLSAQTTDVRVNQVTPVLFQKYPDLMALSQAAVGDVESIIRSLGFYRVKAINIIKLAAMVVDDFNNEIPRSQKELVQLPGVGRKTANVILGNAFGIPGLTVDTHFIRLVNAWEWVRTKDPKRIEEEVAILFDRRDWTLLSHVVIFHGRRVCIARKPLCGVCPLAKFCPSYGSGETDPRKAAKLLRFETAPGMAYAPELYDLAGGHGPPVGAMKVKQNVAVFFPAWRQHPAAPESLAGIGETCVGSHTPDGEKELRLKTKNHG